MIPGLVKGFSGIWSTAPISCRFLWGTLAVVDWRGETRKDRRLEEGVGTV